MNLLFPNKYFFKKFSIIIIVQFIILLSAIPTYALNGVYFTKQQFENNELQLESSYWIKAKGAILWEDFAYETNSGSAIKIKLSKENTKTFEAGSIYGFKKDGIKFRFIKSLNEYLAILYESPVVTFFVKENVYYLYHPTKSIIFLYDTNNDSSLKKFNKQNILDNFPTNLNLQKKLLNLYKKIDREKTWFPYKDFFTWQKKIADDLK